MGALAIGYFDDVSAVLFDVEVIEIHVFSVGNPVYLCVWSFHNL